MDDTALNPQQQSQPTAPAQPVLPQQPVRPVEQPQVTGGHPEAPTRGLPPREAAPIDNAEAGAQTASDDQAAQPDQVSDAADVQQKEAGDQMMQEAHPQVEIAPELQKAGVEQGKDADSSHREEEQLKTDASAKPDTQASASGISLATDPIQLAEVKKKYGIREAIKWLAVSLIRQLKKMNMKPEDQKTTW